MAALASNTNPALKYGAILDQKAPGGNSGTVMVPLYEVQVVSQNGQTASSFASSFTMFVCDNSVGSQQYQIAAVTAVFGTASSSGTLQVEVASGTTAVGSGTNQLTGTISLAGTANTVVNGTLIASPTAISAGSRVNLIFAGTVTSLANCTISVALQRIA